VSIGWLKPSNVLPIFNIAEHKAVKVALSQKRLEDFYIARINIPNHYPEQKI
jgi:hypothetical protein